MTDITFIHLAKPGHHVWTETGFPDHGLTDDPKVTIPPQTHGVVTAIEDADFGYYTIPYCYVTWDSGHQVKHNSETLLFIYPAESYDEYCIMLQSASPETTLKLGPRGGFHGFSMKFRHNKTLFDFDLWESQRRVWKKSFCPFLNGSRSQSKNGSRPR